MKGKIKMEYIKKVFRSYWILSIFCVVLGIALIIDPNFFTAAIGYESNNGVSSSGKTQHFDCCIRCKAA